MGSAGPAAKKLEVVDLASDDGAVQDHRGSAPAAQDRLRLASLGLSSSFVIYPEVFTRLLEWNRSHKFQLSSPTSFVPQPGGWECGFANTQMLLSALMSPENALRFGLGSAVPSVASLQVLIDKAHQAGFDPLGFKQVGLLERSRKWIGSTEVASLFRYLGIPARVVDFTGQMAAANVTEFVALYFKGGLNLAMRKFLASSFSSSSSVDETSETFKALPPLYFQYKGHSWTLVGAKPNFQVVVAFDPLNRDLVQRSGSAGVAVCGSCLRRIPAQHNEFQLVVVGPIPNEPEVFLPESVAFDTRGSPVSKIIDSHLIPG